MYFFPNFIFFRFVQKILVFSNRQTLPFALTPNHMVWLDEITYGRPPPIRSQQIRRTDDHVTSMSQLSSWWRHQSIAVDITTWKVQNELSRLNLTGAIQWTWLVYEVTNQRLVLLANVKMYKKQIYYAKCLFSRKQPIYLFYFLFANSSKSVRFVEKCSQSESSRNSTW